MALKSIVMYKFLAPETVTWLVFFMIKRDLLFAPIKIKWLLVLASVRFSVFTRVKQEELMGWHPSGVKNLQNSSCRGKFQCWTFDRAESEI